MAYSQSFVAVSQSSTMPSELHGFLISRFGRGLWIEFSPKKYWEEPDPVGAMP
jgi:hypothetical protein